MSLAEIIGILVTIGLAAIGAIYAYGRLNERVKDHAEDLADLKERLARAETAAREVHGLAQAIEHMGSRFADQVKHLIETFSIENGHTRQQLADIKDEVRHVRNMGAAQPTPRRRRSPDA